MKHILKLRKAFIGAFSLWHASPENFQLCPSEVFPPFHRGRMSFTKKVIFFCFSSSAIFNFDLEAFSTEKVYTYMQVYRFSTITYIPFARPNPGSFFFFFFYKKMKKMTGERGSLQLFRVECGDIGIQLE